MQVAAAPLSHQLGLLPGPSVRPATAGVKQAWLSLELASLSETASFFFWKPQAWDVAGRHNSAFPLSALENLSQRGIE